MDLIVLTRVPALDPHLNRQKNKRNPGNGKKEGTREIAANRISMLQEFPDPCAGAIAQTPGFICYLVVTSWMRDGLSCHPSSHQVRGLGCDQSLNMSVVGIGFWKTKASGNSLPQCG
ncbi:hypothetical protein AVEN_148166-1 [Araneus ventricosus]|uniref:Uncharacterized protein n=1 Tax=Araneus ventricosus TaxID=182803 RepID=A0A4Y2THD5_ARAVE|nr:hypothetical protein AVEN_148166-1 [Araneus ventricosus]